MCKISNFQFIRLVIICFLPISGSSDDKVRLTDVTALTLRRGQYTTARRSPAVPQLRCVGGSAKGLYEPAVIQCYNRGFDGADMQWECKAEMDEAYQFGMIQISCEGYSYPEDPYILRGSCGLQYELEKTKYYDNRSLKQKNENDENFSLETLVHFHRHRNCRSGYSTLFTLVLIACLFYFVYSVWPFSRDGNNRDHFGVCFIKYKRTLH
ncbi:unnamed protein product [Dracunculus medinensis]|uniref:Store-operated calcium entry-associated regulatory factor n=1 Tax=Dracunculus medinensis TaxID=318479 RepID=A0A158Q2V2_DRAME|nr:unnamed protein product [Dracunculus medinensis]